MSKKMLAVIILCLGSLALVSSRPIGCETDNKNYFSKISGYWNPIIDLFDYCSFNKSGEDALKIHSSFEQNEFSEWMIPNINKILPKNHYFILVLDEGDLYAYSLENGEKYKISAKKISAIRQLSFDGKLLELISGDKSIFVDLEKEITFSHPIYKSQECLTRPVSPDMHWKIDLCGPYKKEVNFINIATKKNEYSIVMPNNWNEFLSWSFNRNLLALVQTDLEYIEPNQPGSISIIDTSCLELKTNCKPEIIHSIQIDDYPMWGGIASSWSPNNESLAFVNINRPADIILLDISSLARKKIEFSENEIISSIYWSPNGRSLLLKQGEDIKYLTISNNDLKSVIIKTSAVPKGWLSTYRRPIFIKGNTLIVTGAGLGLKLQKEHDLKSEIYRPLLNDEKVIVVENPIEVENFTWLKVKTERDNLYGWLIVNSDSFSMEW